MTVACSIALAAAIVLLLGGPALGVDPPVGPPDDVLGKVSQNPAIIRGQLDLCRLYAQQALHRLRTAPAAETPETLGPTLQASYTHLSLGTSGVHLKLAAGRNGRFVNPLLEMVASELDKAMVHIRNAGHSASAVSADRPDAAQQVILRLEATIAIVEQVMDLI